MSTKVRMTKPQRENHWPRLSVFGFGISFVIRHWSFVILRRHALCLRFFRLLLPLAGFVLMNATERQQFFLVVDHLFPTGADERVIFHQENGFFRANFLAITAEDAAKHINL